MGAIRFMGQTPIEISGVPLPCHVVHTGKEGFLQILEELWEKYFGEWIFGNFKGIENRTE